MPTSKKRSSGESVPMSGAKKRHIMAAPQSDEEIILKAAELLQAGSHRSNPKVQDAIRSITSSSQEPRETRFLDSTNAGKAIIQPRVGHSTANTSHSRGPQPTLYGSEQPHPRHNFDLPNQTSEWVPQWTSNAQQLYHPIGFDSFIHAPHEPQVFQRTALEGVHGSSNLDTFHPGFMNYMADSHRSSQGPFSAGEPFLSLVEPSLLEGSTLGGDFSTLLSQGMSQTLIPRETRLVFDTDSWDDLGSTSNQPPGSSSSDSLDWELEEVPVPHPQSSSDRSQSSTELVLEQFVDLNLPFGELLWQPKRRQHGRFESESKRQETCSTRKRGACLRCKMQRVRCLPNPEDPDGNCKTCADYSKLSKQTIHLLPCLRYKLTESTLFRTGQLYVQPDLIWSNRWAAIKMTEITEWADSDLKRIKVSQGLCPKSFEVFVRKFVPIKGDSLQRKWVDGKTRKSKNVPPYAIENMAKTARRLRKFIEENTDSAIDHLMSDKEPLLKETYAMAKQYAKTAQRHEERLLVHNLLQLWFAVRQTTRSEFIVGEETLGMTPELKDRSYPLFGKIPIPPVMGLQFNIMLTLNVLLPLKKSVLDQLQQAISSNRPKSWFTIYLCTFVLLHNCALITAWCYDYARKHGLKERYSYPRVVEDLYHAANMLLAYFHYCNKGQHLLSIKLENRHDTVLSDLGIPEYRFMIRTIELVRQKEEDFASLKAYNLYEDDFYFVSQMFEKGWGPRDSYVSPV